MEFIDFLQACITPVALISGVGLLLLTITNRLGRTIDRTRQLVAELNRTATGNSSDQPAGTGNTGMGNTGMGNTGMENTLEGNAGMNGVKISRMVKMETEIRILYKRSRILRNSIAAMVISVISSSLIIPTLFFMILLEVDLRTVGYALFVVSILSILVSSIYFFIDVRLSLRALRLEAREYLED
jgi:hypothetical protein